MKFAVLVFPGSNCDIDCYKAVEESLGEPVDYVWHTATDLSAYDCILVPGASPMVTICAAARFPGSLR